MILGAKWNRTASVHPGTIVVRIDRKTAADRVGQDLLADCSPPSTNSIRISPKKKVLNSALAKTGRRKNPTSFRGPQGHKISPTSGAEANICAVVDESDSAFPQFLGELFGCRAGFLIWASETEVIACPIKPAAGSEHYDLHRAGWQGYGTGERRFVLKSALAQITICWRS